MQHASAVRRDPDSSSRFTPTSALAPHPLTTNMSMGPRRPRRAPEQPEEPFVMPTTVEEVEKLSWGQLLYLVGENSEALGMNGTAPAPP